MNSSPRVREGVRLYAIGDIHGRADLVRGMVERIQEDDARRPASDERRLVFLGDYVDRGKESRQVIDYLLGGLPDGFATTFLMGNHERMMLDAILDPAAVDLWRANGGDVAMRSYGLDPKTMAREPERLAKELPEEHIGFLRTLELMYISGDYACVHAGVRPGVPLARQQPRDLLWIRSEFLNDRRDHGKVIVHGHTPRPRPEKRPNRIGIDTGAVMTGLLTALCLEGHEQRFLIHSGDA